MTELLNSLNALEDNHIFYRLSNPRREAVMVEIVLPGEHWEVEFFASGEVEAECFRSDGQILGPEVLNDIITKNSN